MAETQAQTQAQPDQHEPLKFEELFLTQHEHFTIRTLSQILKWTESLVGGREVPHNGYVVVGDDEDHAARYRILNSFCQTINRGGDEVIALLPESFTGTELTVFSAMSTVEEYSSKIPFALVPHFALALLKHAHPESSRQAGKDAFDNFGLFTMCLGFPRLSARLGLGIKSRNFFQVIMLRSTQSEDEDQEAEDETPRPFKRNENTHSAGTSCD
ncbi:uncharacterized protein PV07_08767 [Cladophialophora immunda]|uniref:Uncharacterized protein n=1 Tax=Cladophialophora immunda TaxID=569365 RepID=A0A0D1ZCY0_9EURO|nr:uncharacterized protein PV07_08767 [Cladophialophora immunda]KIW25601.1 hypothetical protein PV07_08767 [Cladophialophora immunda]